MTSLWSAETRLHSANIPCIHTLMSALEFYFLTFTSPLTIDPPHPFLLLCKQWWIRDLAGQEFTINIHQENEPPLFFPERTVSRTCLNGFFSDRPTDPDKILDTITFGGPALSSYAENFSLPTALFHFSLTWCCPITSAARTDQSQCTDHLKLLLLQSFKA